MQKGVVAGWSLHHPVVSVRQKLLVLVDVVIPIRNNASVNFDRSPIIFRTLMGGRMGLEMVGGGSSSPSGHDVCGTQNFSALGPRLYHSDESQAQTTCEMTVDCPPASVPWYRVVVERGVWP